jgi:cytochrome c
MRRARLAGLCGMAVLALFGGAWLGSRPPAERAAVAAALTGGDPARAPRLIARYGCGGCHTIPGVAGADGKVAPPLGGLLDRVYIGGVARNTPDNLVAWIVNPPRFSPHTAMPPTGIGEREARDVAAFLYAH